MNTNRKNVVFLISIFLLFMCYSISINIAVEEEKIDYRVNEMYHSPSETRIITFYGSIVNLYDGNLNELGRIPPGYTRPAGENEPTWSLDEKYVIIHSRYSLYFLNTLNLEPVYIIPYSILGFPNVAQYRPLNANFYIDSDYNIHYVISEQLKKYNPFTEEIIGLSQLAGHDGNLINVRFHQQGRYMLLFNFDESTSTSKYEIYDIESNTTQIIPKGHVFAPTKPIIAGYNTTDDIFYFYDFEKNEYLDLRMNIDSYTLDRNSNNLFSSDSSMVININSEVSGLGETQTIEIIDLSSGIVEEEFRFTSGKILESLSAQNAFTWLFKREKLIIYNYNTGVSYLLSQNLNLASNLLNSFSKIIFEYIWLILVLGIIIFSVINNLVNFKLIKENFVFEFDYSYRKNLNPYWRSYFKWGLIIYYFFYLNTYFQSIVGDAPSVTKYLFYSGLRYVDILLMTLYTLTNISYDRDDRIVFSRSSTLKILVSWAVVGIFLKLSIFSSFLNFSDGLMRLLSLIYAAVYYLLALRNDFETELDLERHHKEKLTKSTFLVVLYTLIFMIAISI